MKRTILKIELLIALLIPVLIFSCTTKFTSRPAKLSRGPLFFMMKPEQSDNHRKNTLYVIDLQSDLKPQPLVASEHTYIPVKARLSRNLILLHMYQPTYGLFLFNSDNGDLKPLLPNSRTELLSIENGKIFFLGDMNKPQYGYKLKSEGTSARIESEPKNVKRLFVAPVSSPLNPTPICNETILSILLNSGNYFWLILDNAKPELWRVSKDGVDKKKIIDIPPEWCISMLSAGLSPNGKLLALGVTNNNDFFEHRDLIIVDTEKPAIADEYQDIPVRVSLLSSQSPHLSFIWLNDETIRFSETVITSQKYFAEGYFQWVDLEIATGKRLLEQKYGGMELSHATPAKDTLVVDKKPRRWSDGFFEWEYSKLFFKGETEPIVETVHNRVGGHVEMAVCPAGKWAAYICYEDNITYLVNGKDRTKKKLMDGYCYALCWLPGIE